VPDEGDVARRPHPSVLVAIVNYRSAQLTLRCLASLERERERARGEGGPGALAVLVVENASGDEAVLAREIAGRFAGWVTLLPSPVNGGFGAGNNLALRWAFARGAPPDYFLFLNPDTEVRPGAVAELVAFLEREPGAGLAGSSFEHADGTPWPIAFRFPTPLGELEHGLSLGLASRLLAGRAVSRTMGAEAAPVDWFPGASMMVRRQVIEQIGGFDEGYFLYYEETDFCLRARRAGWAAWYVPASRVMHVRGQSTGVTTLEGEPRRLPGYWFESRRRYYATNHGVGYALLADLAFLAGHGLGEVKRRLRRRRGTPSLLRDLLRASVLLPHNRRGVGPRSCYRPAAPGAATPAGPGARP
jgi:N-acetylglucosaminyl-diphospho-decaprenol L-rhamnosyltransferase